MFIPNGVNTAQNDNTGLSLFLYSLYTADLKMLASFLPSSITNFDAIR